MYIQKLPRPSGRNLTEKESEITYKIHKLTDSYHKKGRELKDALSHYHQIQTRDHKNGITYDKSTGKRIFPISGEQLKYIEKIGKIKMQTNRIKRDREEDIRLLGKMVKRK